MENNSNNLPNLPSNSHTNPKLIYKPTTSLFSVCEPDQSLPFMEKCYQDADNEINTILWSLKQSIPANKDSDVDFKGSLHGGSVPEAKADLKEHLNTQDQKLSSSTQNKKEQKFVPLSQPKLASRKNQEAQVLQNLQIFSDQSCLASKNVIQDIKGLEQPGLQSQESYSFNSNLYDAYRIPIESSQVNLSGFNGQYSCVPAVLIIITCIALFVLFYKKYQALKSKYSELESKNTKLILENEKLVLQNTTVTLAFQSNCQLNKIDQKNNDENNRQAHLKYYEHKSKCEHEQCDCSSIIMFSQAPLKTHKSLNQSSPLSVSSPSVKDGKDYDNLNQGPKTYIDKLWMMPYGRPRICSYEVQSQTEHKLVAEERSPLQKQLTSRKNHYNTPLRQQAFQYSPIMKSIDSNIKDYEGSQTSMKIGQTYNQNSIGSNDQFSTRLNQSKRTLSISRQQHILIEDQEDMQKHQLNFKQNLNGILGRQSKNKQDMPLYPNSKWKEDNCSSAVQQCKYNNQIFTAIQQTKSPVCNQTNPNQPRDQFKDLIPAMSRFQEKFMNRFNSSTEQQLATTLDSSQKSHNDLYELPLNSNSIGSFNRLQGGKIDIEPIQQSYQRLPSTNNQPGRRFVPSQFMIINNQQSTKNTHFNQPEIKQRGQSVNQNRQIFNLKNSKRVVSPQLVPLASYPHTALSNRASTIALKHQNPFMHQKLSKNLFSPPLNGHISQNSKVNNIANPLLEQFKLPQLAHIQQHRLSKASSNVLPQFLQNIKQTNEDQIDQLTMYDSHIKKINILQDSTICGASIGSSNNQLQNIGKISRHVSQILSENFIQSQKSSQRQINDQLQQVETYQIQSYNQGCTGRVRNGGTTAGAEEGDEASFEMQYESYFGDFQVGYNSDDDSNNSDSQSCASQQLENNIMSPVLNHQQASLQTSSSYYQNQLNFKYQYSASPKTKHQGFVQINQQLQPHGISGGIKKLSFKQKRTNLHHYATNIQELKNNVSVRKQSAPANFCKSSTSIQDPFSMTTQNNINEFGNNLVYLENGRYKNSFDELSILGQGGFGKVYKVQHKLDSNFYAIKKVRLHLAQDQDIKEHKVYREIMALPQLNHKNVVRYFGCWAEKIDQEDQTRIQNRVEKIKKHLVKQESKRRKRHENRAQKQLQQVRIRPSQFKSKKDSKLFNLKQPSFTDELDYEFEGLEIDKESNKNNNNQTIQSHESESSLTSDKSNFYVGSQSSEDSSFSDSSMSSRASSITESRVNQIINRHFTKPISKDELEEENDDEEEKKDNINSQLYSESENDFMGTDENLSDYSDGDSEDDFDEEIDGENTRINMFDDDALIEFIKGEKKFITIDLMIQMEYCSGHTLQEHLEQQNRTVESNENLNYFKQLLSAVRHIHQNGFIHRDLKPANIFIEGQTVKVGDFGLARKFDNHSSCSNFQKLAAALIGTNQYNKASPKFTDGIIKNISGDGLSGTGRSIKKNKSNLKQILARSLSQQSILTTQIGTSTYLSPEQEKNKSYNQKVDIYALGLILCEMCSKFSTLHERISTINDLKYNAKLPQAMIQNYAVQSEIILALTQKDAEKRPHAQDLIKSDLLEKWAKTLSKQTQFNSTISPRDMLESNQSETTISPQKSYHRGSFDGPPAIKGEANNRSMNSTDLGQQKYAQSPIQKIQQFEPSQTLKNGIVLMSTQSVKLSQLAIPTALEKSSNNQNHEFIQDLDKNQLKAIPLKMEDIMK